MRTQDELLQLFINELQSQNPELTDTEIGSIIDVLGGALSTAVYEIQQLTIDEFRKTFFDTANGPEITGGADDLENLAVDHFGDEFARPAAEKSTGVVTFSRPNADAGNVSIIAGTVVKTPANAAGNSERFEVESDVTLTGLSINASVKALVAGVSGNVQANKVTQVETALTDPSIVVNNASAFAGGKAEENDVEYRETIRTLLKSLKGGTLEAIEAKALTVGGIEFAKALEFLQYVKEWNVGGGVPVGDYFAIPRVKLYVADANGVASLPLVALVQAAVDTTRAAGVRVEVLAAIALSQNWQASIALNPGGPNFSTLSVDPQMIEDEMLKYIQDLPIGSGFNRAAAKNYIMGLFGPSGTNDLTNFSTSTPSGDVTAAANQKLIPGTIGIS